MKYALMTAARNEASYIEGTIKSVIGQTLKPVSWVIASDGSTDGTDEIVREYMKDHSFIRLIGIEAADRPEGFNAKVRALRIAYECLKPLEFECIGNLDADITMESDYYERILGKFKEDKKLGLAGGVVYDVWGGKRVRRSPPKENYVSGGIQVFRRACYKGIGGYPSLREGGEDTVAAVSARLAGWHVAMFPELAVLHHKEGARTRGGLGESFREGAMFFTLGSHFFVELGKSLLHMRKKPYIFSGLSRALGFLWAYGSGKERVVGEEFVRLIRKEQMERIWAKIAFWERPSPGEALLGRRTKDPKRFLNMGGAGKRK